MSERLVRVNSLGLVLPPPHFDCIEGEQHKRFITEENCFVDEHHLYFSRHKFSAHDDELVRDFANHQFNRIQMPRCQHIRYHQLKTQTAIPRPEVMRAFLDEAAILTRLGIVTKALVEIETALFTDNVRKVARNPDRYLEVYDEFDARRSELTKQVAQLEVIPSRLITAGLERFMPKADALQLQVAA